MKHVKRDFNEHGRHGRQRGILSRAIVFDERTLDRAIWGQSPSSPPESVSSRSSNEYEPLLRRDIENNVLTALSGDDIDSATMLWQHENALIRIPAQFVR
ncbi:hypothetical protein NX059_005218 [Plenodomus lindquistii]|nr:hypothetical protein NX059_005218 [Plenodomus lindquistii]